MKHRKMSALRYAKEHGYKVFTKVDQIKDYSMEVYLQLTLMYGNLDTEEVACFNWTYGDGFIVIRNHKSQLEANLALWHEIGHLEDYKQLGVFIYQNMYVVKKEVRASTIAAKKLAKYGFAHKRAKELLSEWLYCYTSFYCLFNSHTYSDKLTIACNKYLG